jgi:hypothetical protein
MRAGFAAHKHRIALTVAPCINPPVNPHRSGCRADYNGRYAVKEDVLLTALSCRFLHRGKMEVARVPMDNIVV